MKASKKKGSTQDEDEGEFAGSKHRKVIINHKYKPKDFTYQMVIEVDFDTDTVRVLDVVKGNIQIGIAKMIQFSGHVQVNKEIAKALIANDITPKGLTVVLQQPSQEP
jgi:hypothetical protein